MLNATSLRALRYLTTAVAGDIDQATIRSDQDIIAHTTRYFPSCNFIVLASKLLNIARINGIRWDQVYWVFADGREDGTVLTMYYISTTAHGKLTLVRRFVYEKDYLVAHHDYLEIPEALQENGISRAINQVMYAVYQQLNVQYIRVHAALEAGGYVWAKVGFSATQRVEVEQVLYDALEKIDSGETELLTLPLIHALRRQVVSHYEQSQEHFPIWRWGGNKVYGRELLLGSHWHGELKLTKSVPLGIFVKYLNKK